MFPAPSHSTVAFDAGIPMLGGVVSSMVKLAVVGLELPHSSVAVKVTVTDPVPPHRSLRLAGLKLLVQVTLPQISVAVAPALLCTQAVRFIRFPWPSHSTIRFCVGVPIAGAEVSCMVIVAVVSLVFPHSSVAVKTTVAVPVAPHSSLNDA